MNPLRCDVPRACVFDAYGTLFDYDSAAARCGEALGSKRETLNNLWRGKQLQYTWLRALQDRHVDFWQVTQDALDYAFDMHGVRDGDLRQDLMEAYLQLDCYPEVPDALTELKNSADYNFARDKFEGWDVWGNEV